jgi:hypothetical protein|tara:strand:+ start:435 stop:746 length:312 start_codon:yes stop_codon:yes gene_type:complete
METILTVLITLGVVLLMYAVVGVVRLSRKVDELELLRMEVVDVESRMEKMWGELSHELHQYQDQNESNMDRRLDNIWNDLHKTKTLTKKLDKTLNPNKDLLKS